MRIVAVLVLLTLSLEAGPAGACFMNAARFTDFMNKSDVETPQGDYFSEGLFSGYIQGVFDVYAALGFICPTSMTVGDAHALVRRHFKTVMDKDDALPSQTCAEDVIMKIFMERFPCQPPDGNPA